MVYLQRPNGEGAKAGNLNHARQYSSGEVILVLDAGRPPVLQVTTCVAYILYIGVDAVTLARQVGRVLTVNALFGRCFACFALFACAFNDKTRNNSSP